MREDSFTLSEKKEIALKLKGVFENEGFETSMPDETRVQVTDLPIPKIAPFDTAKLIVMVDEYDIYFALVFNFIKVLEDLIDADEINKVYGDLHNEWFDKLVAYLSPIDPTGMLKWDIEYELILRILGMEILILLRKLPNLFII